LAKPLPDLLPSVRRTDPTTQFIIIYVWGLLTPQPRSTGSAVALSTLLYPQEQCCPRPDVTFSKLKDTATFGHRPVSLSTLAVPLLATPFTYLDSLLQPPVTAF